jgi:hypothetical protein
MSRGLGTVQRRISAAFQAHRGKSFTINDLAKVAYPNAEIQRVHLSAMRRSLKRLVPELGLRQYRAGTWGRGGWHYHYQMP